VQRCTTSSAILKLSLLLKDNFKIKIIFHVDRNLEQRFELFVGKYELELEEFQESSQVI
jgi:hypothetical protein